MSSAAALKDSPNFPLYFFDQVSRTVIHYSGSRLKRPDISTAASFLLQPSKRNQTKRSIFYFIVSSEGSQLGDGR